MKQTDEFVDYAVELLQAAGAVVARRMFGGYGLYVGAAMFALIADGELYLKADESNRADFERAGSAPFTYEAAGRRAVMSYFRMPDEAMESSDAAAPWARSALAAALRARSARSRRRAPPPRRIKRSRGG